MGAFTEHGMTLTDGETVTVKLDIIAIKVFWHGERLECVQTLKENLESISEEQGHES